MLETLINNFTFHVVCSTVYFGMYVLNCYVLKNKKAKLPYKVMFTGLLPFLNIASVLMQLCFLIPAAYSILSKLIYSIKADKAVTELGYTKKSNSSNTRVPKRA